MKEGYKRNRSEEFCHSILDTSDGRKRIPFSWVFACISFPLPPFLVVSKSFSWSVPLLSVFIVFLSPSPDCDLVPSYCAMCWHTVRLWPRYGGAFHLAASSCGVTAERSQMKFVRNALMQLLNSVPYLLKLLLFFLLIFLFQEMPYPLRDYPQSPGCCIRVWLAAKGPAHSIWKEKRPLQSDMDEMQAWMFVCLPFIFISHI